MQALRRRQVQMQVGLGAVQVQAGAVAVSRCFVPFLLKSATEGQNAATGWDL